MLLILSAVLGACMGSFLDTVASRSVAGRRWWGRERSICESCGRKLSALELIPIISWLIQKGRCKSCGAKLSPRYLISELICSVGTFIIAWRFGASLSGAIALLVLYSSFVNGLTDYESGDIFDLLALTPAAIGLALRCFINFAAFIDGVLGALLGWGIFAIIILASRFFSKREGMGWGDAIFMCGAGALLGWRMTALAFYIGVMLGGVYAAVLLARGLAKWGRGDAMPLVPWLGAGCCVAAIFGERILNLFIGR